MRRDPSAQVSGGTLRWPTRAADQTGGLNDAAVLLHDPGTGPWTAIASVSIDPGADTVRSFQQARLIGYVDDHKFARLSHMAIWNTRQVEFGDETPSAGGPS